MPRHSSPSTTSFSMRLTGEERFALEEMAGGATLSAYIREQLLGAKAGKRTRGANRPVKDQADLAQVLALLGSTDAFTSLTEIANAAKSGALLWDDEAAATLERATDDLAAIKALLMNALGVKPE